jgi:hypothetical protein
VFKISIYQPECKICFAMVTRFQVVMGVFLFLLILVLPSCEKVNAGSFYISNNGNDKADGHSPRSAWRTIKKLNSAVLSPGDSIFFEAGGTWRETLEIKHSGSPHLFIVYTRYGKGKNPSILGSDPAVNWTLTDVPYIWKSESDLIDPRGNYYPGEIFFILNDSIIWGNYQTNDNSFANLKKPHDWTYKSSSLFVYSEVSPEIKYQRVEATQRNQAVRMQDQHPESYIEWNGIDMLFARTEGFYAGYPAVNGATDLIFRNSHIGYIGEKGSGRAYGIALFHSNLIVENCTISDCGRRGISFNLYLQTSYREHRNIQHIIVRNNIFKRGYHTTSLDLACTNITGDTIQDVYFYNNIVDDSELKMTDGDVPSNQIFTQSGGAYLNRLYIYNNIFIQATARNILIEGGDSIFIWNNTIAGHNPHIITHPYANVSLNYALNIDFRNNILFDNLPDNRLQNHGVLMEQIPGKFIEKDYNLYFSLFPKTDRNFSAHRPDCNPDRPMGYWNTMNWDEYKYYNTKFEKNSPRPQPPLFKNNLNDFRLKKGSPAIGAGVTIQLIKTDFFGNEMNEPPDLGAIQYMD